MTFKTVSGRPSPWALFMEASRFLWAQRQQFFYLAALPIFLILLQRLVFSFIPVPPTVKQFFFAVLAIVGLLLQVVFAVQWIRLCVLRVQETQVFVPTSVDRRYLMYGVLSLGVFFMAGIAQSVVAFFVTPLFSLAGGQIAGIMASMLLIVILKMLLLARLASAFVGVSVDKPFQINGVWDQSKPYWKPLFGYMVLLDTVSGALAAGVYFAYLKLDPAAAIDPKFLMNLLLENSWIMQIIAYVFLALKLYGMCVYTKSVR